MPLAPAHHQMRILNKLACRCFQKIGVAFRDIAYAVNCRRKERGKSANFRCRPMISLALPIQSSVQTFKREIVAIAYRNRTARWTHVARNMQKRRSRSDYTSRFMCAKVKESSDQTDNLKRQIAKLCISGVSFPGASAALHWQTVKLGGDGQASAVNVVSRCPSVLTTIQLATKTEKKCNTLVRLHAGGLGGTAGGRSRSGF